jgi:hypothetical protein
MQTQVLDLDGSVSFQKKLLASYPTAVHSFQRWGPRIRMACSHRRYRRFELALARSLGGTVDSRPTLTFYGSGDFHHVSLALVRRLRVPVNLLVLDKHPDWMRGVPFLHCGTWLYHAARLPHVQAIFHVGGDVDFDNYYRWMAPWPLLRSGKITVFPAVRRFERGAWSELSNEPVRLEADTPVTLDRVERLLKPFREPLERAPLYMSLDKDVLIEQDAAVNWDSGHLRLAEVDIVLNAFLRAAGGNWAGMDIVGDWSPVCLQGGLRRLMHATEHPVLNVEPMEAARRNEKTNLKLVEFLRASALPHDANQCPQDSGIVF